MSKLVVAVRVLEALVLLAIGVVPALCLDVVYRLFGWTPWQHWVTVRVEEREEGQAFVFAILFLFFFFLLVAAGLYYVFGINIARMAGL